uniref:uncharacterized protein LOC122608286 n=1 Tax=Erigeron canadensis TaxID=72917 RepID=UPI001CB9CC27|nr:uncharacterized protein LOC122608286 [Erigeron canadensis]
MHHSKKVKKTASFGNEMKQEPMNPTNTMSVAEKQKLASDLVESAADLPESIIKFAFDNCSNGNATMEEGIELDLGTLSNDTLFKLRKLLDDFLAGKQKNIVPFQKKRKTKNKTGNPTTKEQGQQLPTKASTSQCSIICVQGYEVKESIAPILEAIFKKHGDIASECIYTIASVKASLLEVVCEVVGRIQADDVIEKMEEIESLVSLAEAAKINVSWLWVHLEAINRRKDVMKKCSLLMETKVITVLVQMAAQMDLRERCAELVTAHERFKEAERCVRVLHLVEKKLNNNILDSKAEKDLWGRQPLL